MKMPYVRFLAFYDHMIYIMNMDSKEGRAQNRAKDEKFAKRAGVAPKNTALDDMKKLKKLFTNKK